ncbi:MAG: hypothetical protein HY595_05580 [Candidatus Omnitrophica bacterium]|nr:hypothetical protein [Candidatus Omnitrophota bacterium]
MSPLDVFLLGLASGLTILTITAYRRLSPRWLRWLLIVMALLLLSGYATLAHVTVDESWLRWWRLIRSVGLTLPGVFAVDQLIRHPAVTPKKVLRWYSPWFIAYGIMSFTPWWRWTTPVVTSGFGLVLLWISGMVIRKLPDRRIRLALISLSLAYLVMGLSGLLLADMLVLLALWSAYETSATS